MIIRWPSSLPLPHPNEYTFAMLKPDGYRANRLGAVLDLAYNSPAELRPVLLMEKTLTEPDVEFLYGHVREKYPEVWPVLRAFQLSDPSVLILFRGNRKAVTAWRETMGATDSIKAPPRTIRAFWGSRTVMCENVVHGSDSFLRALEEISYFLPDDLNHQVFNLNPYLPK
jgi:nucleoside diphosphate kinase